MWWLWLLLLIIFVPLLILFLPFKLSLTFTDELNLEARFLFIQLLNTNDKKKKRQKRGTPLAESTTILEEYGFKISEIGTYLKAVKDVLIILERHVRKKLVIRNLRLKIFFGTGDAADTAIYTGTLQSIVSAFYAYVSENYQLKNYDISVTPDFDKKITDIDFEASALVNLWWVINLCVQEEAALVSINNILKKKDGVNYE